MYQGYRLAIVIPARDEAQALPVVLTALPSFIDRVVVCDNGSTDNTGEVARALGAEVVEEPRPGYGSACKRALAHLQSGPIPDIVVFVDGDGSDCLSDLISLVEPIVSGQAALVIGSRIARAEPGALTPVQRFGNQFAGLLIRLIWGGRVSDLGPFRVIGWDTLQRLNMQDGDFGWTVEMQVKAARLKLRICEVPVAYRRRVAGRSKIAGTLAGSVRAGTKILSVIGRECLADVGRSLAALRRS